MTKIVEMEKRFEEARRMVEEERKRRAMLKVDFSVSLNANLEVISVRRTCKIPCPTCKGCAFEKICDEMQKRIEESLMEMNEVKIKEV